MLITSSVGLMNTQGWILIKGRALKSLSITLNNFFNFPLFTMEVAALRTASTCWKGNFENERQHQNKFYFTHACSSSKE